MSDYREILKKIKPSLDINFELKISELERELAHLNLTIKKLKEENNILALKIKSSKGINEREILKLANEQLRKTYNKKYSALKIHLEKLRVEAIAKKKIHMQTSLEYEFLRRRVKQIYGINGYIKLMNHVENPQEDGFLIGEDAKIKNKKRGVDERE